MNDSLAYLIESSEKGKARDFVFSSLCTPSNITVIDWAQEKFYSYLF